MTISATAMGDTTIPKKIELVGRSRYARYCLKEHKGVTDE